MHVSFLSIANFLVNIFVKSERALLGKIKIAWLHLKKFTENTSFGTTELCKYCAQYPVNNTYNNETYTIIEGESHRVEGRIKKGQIYVTSFINNPLVRK